MDHVQRSKEAYGRSAGRHLAAVGSTVSDRFEAAADLELLTAFARGAAARGGLALDAGCGTGRIARLLDDQGAAVVGVDVAPGMVDVARREHPHLPFAVGELARLPLAAGGLDTVISWYSIITTPPAALAAVWSELARVLAPDGVVLVAFQAGDGSTVARPDAYGSGIDLTLQRHDPTQVAHGLRRAGLDVDEPTVRGPLLDHEDSPQAFVIARRSAP